MTELPEKDELTKLLDTLVRFDTISAKLSAYLKIKAMFRKLENEIEELKGQRHE